MSETSKNAAPDVDALEPIFAELRAKTDLLEPSDAFFARVYGDAADVLAERANMAEPAAIAKNTAAKPARKSWFSTVFDGVSAPLQGALALGVVGCLGVALGYGDPAALTSSALASIVDSGVTSLSETAEDATVFDLVAWEG